MNEVTIIGAAIADILVQPCDASVFEKGSYACEEIKMNVGGDALNEATILSHFSHSVELVTILGCDDTGKYIKNHCENVGIELKGSCYHEGYTTGMNVVLVSEDASRHFLTNRNGTLRKLELKHIPLDFDCKILSFASIFVFPMIKDKELETIFKYAKEKGICVCADMTKCKNNETLEDLKHCLPYIDYIFPNAEEALLVTREDSIEKAAESFFKYGIKNVIIKAGSKGCFVKNKQYNQYFSCDTVTSIDTTGAGDSFVSGFIHGLCLDRSFDECISIANEFGSKSVQFVGSTTWLDKFE